MTDIKLETVSLDAGYSDIIVKDVNIKVGAGKILTLIGANGSGKSTLIKTLSGIIPKKGGRVIICGEDSETLTQQKLAKRMALLLTERIKAELMTCREVVETGRYPYTGYFGRLSDEDKSIVNEAIALTGTEEIADMEFTKLSDGQRQRVLLARAICQSMELLVLDEPVSYLDARHKILFLDTLRLLAEKKGTAVIMSMHELNYAAEISDSILALKNGRVHSYGSAADVLTESNIKTVFDISDEMYNIYLKKKG